MSGNKFLETSQEDRAMYQSVHVTPQGQPGVILLNRVLDLE